MALPPKLFYPIAEIAPRWSVSPLDIVGWAIDGRISLSAALAAGRGETEPASSRASSRSPARTSSICSAPGIKKKSTVRDPTVPAQTGCTMGEDRQSNRGRDVEALQRPHRAHRGRAISSASMDFSAITPLATTSIQRKPPRFRSASPALQPATTGMPSPALSRGVFTTRACRRARANWSATCSTGSPRQVPYRTRAQFAGASRRCGRY